MQNHLIDALSVLRKGTATGMLISRRSEYPKKPILNLHVAGCFF